MGQNEAARRSQLESLILVPVSRIPCSRVPVSKVPFWDFGIPTFDSHPFVSAAFSDHSESKVDVRTRGLAEPSHQDMDAKLAPRRRPLRGLPIVMGLRPTVRDPFEQLWNGLLAGRGSCRSLGINPEASYGFGSKQNQQTKKSIWTAGEVVHVSICQDSILGTFFGPTPLLTFHLLKNMCLFFMICPVGVEGDASSLAIYSCIFPRSLCKWK